MDNDPVQTLIKEKYGKEPGSFMSAMPSQSPLLYWVKEESPSHWYIVTSGFRQFGFELTSRIKRDEKEENPHEWIQRYMNDLYTYVSSTGSGFVDQDFMEYTDHPLDHTGKTVFVGSVFVLDPVL